MAPKKANKISRMSKRAHYTDKDILNAIEDVKSGRLSKLAASKLYGIPRTTLIDKISGKAPVNKKMGSDTFLTQAEEDVLVNLIISGQKRALPITKDSIMSLVCSLISDERNRLDINRNRPYKFGKQGSALPGNKWYSLFMHRHPNIVRRTSESLSAARMNVSQQVIRQWFSNIRGYLSENNLLDILQDPKRIFNIDENSHIVVDNSTTPSVAPITPNSSGSAKNKRSAISPALLNHRWFPSPKKVVPKIKSLTQEMHFASVLTSPEVVGLLKNIRDQKKQTEIAKEFRKQKRVDNAKSKETKSAAVKRKLIQPSKKLSKPSQKKKKADACSSDSESSTTEASLVVSDEDTDTERLQDELDECNPKPSCSSSQKESSSSDEQQSFFLSEPSVGNFVACKFQPEETKGRGSKKENICKVYMAKVMSIASCKDEDRVYEVKFLKEKCDVKTGEPIFYWPDLDDTSDMMREELVVVADPVQRSIGSYRDGGFVFKNKVLKEVNTFLLK